MSVQPLLVRSCAQRHTFECTSYILHYIHSDSIYTIVRSCDTVNPYFAHRELWYDAECRDTVRTVGLFYCQRRNDLRLLFCECVELSLNCLEVVVQRLQLCLA